MRRARLWCIRLFRAGRYVLVFAGIAAVVTITAAARSSHRVGMGVATGPAVKTTTTANPKIGRAQLTASLSFTPQSGATAVAPDAPIVVHAARGWLLSAHLRAANGSEIAGHFLSAQQWESTTPLGYNATYTATATVTDGSVKVDRTTKFTTLSPRDGVTAAVFPNTGLHVGVGQPVVFRFSQAITDPAARAAVLSHIKITVAQPVAGGWYWFSSHELHFRPKTFWPPGDMATVSWDLTGWNVGNGIWGQESGSTHFTIGDARISYANLATDKMTVTENGRTIAVYPISGGKPKDPTMDGVHIVLDRESVVHMVSSTVGIPVNSPDGYDEMVFDDVHISDTGEYVHAAPWSVASQGHTNVSHGCVNLSPQDAEQYFGFSRVGDIVIVTGSPRPPVNGDHGVMDWTTDFSQFAPAHEVPAVTPPAPSSTSRVG